MCFEIANRVNRVNGANHAWIAGDPDHAQAGNGDEPNDDDRTEQAADTVRPILLDDEQRDKNGHRYRYDVRFEEWRRNLKTFHGAKHTDGRRDHAVAVQQRGAKDAKADEDGHLETA